MTNLSSDLLYLEVCEIVEIKDFALDHAKRASQVEGPGRLSNFPILTSQQFQDTL